MKYLPLRDFDNVTNALNFDTADCHIVGGCDLYTTKAVSEDKKLYKNIEHTLETQYASLLSFSASLSPAEARVAAADLNLSRSSPFGPLSQTSSRRTFAYLIATLNASHPDYDFSHLRTSDFRREKSIRSVMNTLDTTLYNLRPKPSQAVLSGSLHWSPQVTSTDAVPSRGNEVWDPRMWKLIDKEMSLKDCSVYCYAPEEDPYDGEEGAIWSFNYFFFNKARKRVCYIYLRGLSILSHNPVLKSPIKPKRAAEIDWSPHEPSSSKRARYWLGDRAVEEFESGWGEDEEEDITEPWETETMTIANLVNDVGSSSCMSNLDEERIVSEKGLPATRRGRSKSTTKRGMSEDMTELMEV